MIFIGLPAALTGITEMEGLCVGSISQDRIKEIQHKELELQTG